MKHTLFPLLILFCQLAVGQDGVLIGTITDSETDEPLIGATVLFESSGVTTDINGKYKLKLPPGKQNVQFSFIGYESRIKEVEIESGVTIRQNVKLKTESIEYQTVVVSASQYEKNIEEETVSVAVVNTQNIQDRNAQEIGEAINKTSGVQVQDGQITIRGGSSYSYGVGSRTAVMVDGMSMMSADLGDAQLKFAPTENAEQIEVIKGSASVVYGSSALNGVVNVLTAWPKSEKPRHVLNTFGSIYDNTPLKAQKWWSDFSTRGAFGLSYLYDQKVGRTDLVAGGNIYRHMSYLEYNDEIRGRLNLKTRIHHKKKKGLNYGVNWNMMFEQGERFFLAEDLDTNAYREADGSNDRYWRMNVDPHLHYTDSSGNRHSADLRWLYLHRFGNGDDPDAISNQIIENYQYQKTWDWNKGFVNEEKYTHKVVLTTGIPASLGISTSNLYTGVRETYAAAVYLQGEYKLGWADKGAVRRAKAKSNSNSNTLRSLSLIGGVRYEILGVENIFEAGLPIFRTGLNWQFGKASFLRASFGQSYRLPTVGERFITNDLFNSLRIVPNPGLLPEQGWNLELGLTQGMKISKWKGIVDAAFFWQEYKNFVEYRFVSVQSNPELFEGDSLFIGLYPNNVENARVAGFEITLSGNGKIGPVTVTPSIGYTYTYPVNADSLSVGQYLSNMFSDIGRKIPTEESGSILQFRNRHLFLGDLSIEWKGISLGGSVYYASYPEVIPETFRIAVGFLSNDFESFDRYEESHKNGDWVFDVRAGYQINDKFRLGFIVKNVGNRYYATRPSRPEPVRNYTLQLRVKF